MFELKVINLLDNSSFGWIFDSEQEANDFLEQMRAKSECPYQIDNEDWEVTIFEVVQ